MFVSGLFCRFLTYHKTTVFLKFSCRVPLYFVAWLLHINTMSLSPSQETDQPVENTSVKARHLNKQGDWLSKEPDVFRGVQMSATTERHALAAWFPALR